jgi:hypothetical protein
MVGVSRVSSSRGRASSERCGRVSSETASVHDMPRMEVAIRAYEDVTYLGARSVYEGRAKELMREWLHGRQRRHKGEKLFEPR